MDKAELGLHPPSSKSPTCVAKGLGLAEAGCIGLGHLWVGRGTSGRWAEQAWGRGRWAKGVCPSRSSTGSLPRTCTSLVPNHPKVPPCDQDAEKRRHGTGPVPDPARNGSQRPGPRCRLCHVCVSLARGLLPPLPPAPTPSRPPQPCCGRSPRGAGRLQPSGKPRTCGAARGRRGERWQPGGAARSALTCK